MNETKRRILDAAKELFATEGIKSTTVSEIAKAAGVAKGTIYKYFESKEEILQEVIHQEAMKVYEEIDEALRGSGTLREKLKNFIIYKLQAIQKRVNLHHITHKRFKDLSEALRRELMFYYDHEVLLIKGLLQEAQQKGEIVVKNMDILAKALGAVSREFDDPWMLEDKDLEKYIDALLDVLFEGLRPRKEGC